MELSDVIRNLEGKREHLDIALNVLKSYANTIEAAPPAAPAPALIEAPAPRHGGRRPKKSAKVREPRKPRGAEGGCAKHPDSTRYKSGQCRQCALDYQKEHHRKKKQPAEAKVRNGASTPQRVAPVKPQSAATPPREFIWSKPWKCPKCGEMARLRRLATADLARDAWIHPGPNCVVKIAHYQIKDDMKYQPDGAPAPERARVRCPDCDESFPNERSMELHAERVHFEGRDSEPHGDDDDI